MPGVRARQRRALRHLGRPVRARAPPRQAAGGLTPSPSSAPSQPQPRHARRGDARRSATAAGQPHAGAAGAGEQQAHPTAGAFVDVVLLACDGAQWLPAALAALEQQTRPADRLVLLDAASGDGSADLLERHTRRSALVGGPRALDVLHVRRGAGLLDAARAALGASDADALTAPPASSAPRPRQHTDVPAAMRWVWLLHDDSAPAPDALEKLLAAVEVAPSVGIAGCKVVDWHDARLLQQVGFSTSAMGRRLTGVEHGDRDQGQRDHRDDVLAVSSAGMLVRRDLLERLGGDPGLTVLAEDLDLCRRARLAGSRVVVVPGAVVRHVDATRSGLRSTPAARALRWTERRDEAHARLAGAAPLALPLVALSVLVGGLARLLVRVAAKQPDRAGGELGAVLSALVRPRRVATARRAAARTAVRPRRALQPLLVPRREVVRWHRDRWARTGITPATGVLPVVAARALAAATTPPSGVPLVRLPSVPHPRGELDPPPDVPPSEHDDDEPATGTARRGLGVLLPLLLLLGVASAAGQHRLLGALGGGRQLVGGALAPAPGLGDLWAAARSDWQPVGLGTAAPADPLLSALAALSLPLAGSPSAAVLAVLLLAPPLAALGAWAAAGTATRSRALRAAAALTWAGGAPLLAATGTGRLGAVLAHLALPWLVLGLARLAAAPARRPALAAGALAGLAAAATTAGAPLLLVPLLLVTAVVGLTLRRWPGALVWVVLPPLAVVGPLVGPALADPRVLLLGPGQPLDGPAATGWRLLLADPGAALGTAGAPGGALLPTALVLVPGALVLLLAVLGLAAAGRRARVARAGWWTAGLALLAGVAAAAAGGWAGPAASLLLAGLLAAALARAPRLLRDPAQRAHDRSAPDDGPDGPGPDPTAGTHRTSPAARWASLAAAVALAAPALLVGAWALQQSGASGPGSVQVRPESAGDPAVTVDAARSPDAVAVLHLSVDDAGAATAELRRGPLTLASTSVVAELARAGGAGAGATSASTAAAADGALRSATALLVAGSDDPRAQLAALGVGYVLLESAPAPADTATSAAASAAAAASPGGGTQVRLDALPGLSRAGSTEAGALYRVLPVSGGGDDAVDRPARARLLAADGTPLAVLPSAGRAVDAALPAAGPEQVEQGHRTVVVAERADRGWTATLDGQHLPVVTVDGWALGVEVPDRAGHLVVDRDGGPLLVWGWLQGAVLVLTALLAVPVPVRGRRAS